MQASGNALEKLGKTKFIRDIKRYWVRYLMLAPGFLGLLIFAYIPMPGIIMAFQKMDLRNGIFRSPFVGLKNFEFLFASSDAWVITRNTVCYNLVFIVLGLVFPVSIALVFTELTWKRCSKVLQTIFIMPHFLSMVVVATIVYSILSPTRGLLNTVLGLTGPNQVDWYVEPRYWPLFLVVISVWKGVGYSSVIYIATISGISSEYYEAAVLDGASKLQQARYITLPCLRPIICINLIQSIGNMFHSDFGLFYTVPRDSGRLYSVTQVLDTYVYRALKDLNNPGMATAAGVYQSVVGFFLVLTANKIISKIDADSAMF